MKPYLISLIICLMIAIMPVQAQTEAPLLAFINSSGQLVISSADGATRWIATNPGEQLYKALGYTWSPDGTQLFFAVERAGLISLRIGQVRAQTSVEVAQVAAPAYGGEWVNADQVRVISGEGDALYSTNSTTAAVPALSAIASPFNTTQPNLVNARAISPAGNAFFGLRDGEYVLGRGDNAQSLGLRNQADARNSGLWSGDWVAYWGTQSATGQSALAVTHAASGQTAALSSDSSTPLQPIAWLTTGPSLIYRDPMGQLRVADFACLQSGCDGSPFDAAITILPASASEVQVVDQMIYFRDNATIQALDSACIAENACLDRRITLAQNAAPRTLVHVVGQTLVYTAFAQEATNPADRSIQRLDTACLPDACEPRLVLPDAVAGLLAPSGQYVVAEVIGDGLYTLRLSDLNPVFLAEVVENDALVYARWGG